MSILQCKRPFRQQIRLYLDLHYSRSFYLKHTLSMSSDAIDGGEIIIRYQFKLFWVGYEVTTRLLFNVLNIRRNTFNNHSRNSNTHHGYTDNRKSNWLIFSYLKKIVIIRLINNDKIVLRTETEDCSSVFYDILEILSINKGPWEINRFHFLHWYMFWNTMNCK
jgi:hypothetical protein